MAGESFEKLIKKYQDYAKSKGFKLNPDKKVVTMVFQGMLARQKKYGKRYCPCRRLSGNPKEDRKMVCPCQFHLEELDKSGRCLCGLFVKG